MSSAPDAGGGRIDESNTAVVGPGHDRPVITDRPRARSRDVAAVVEVRDVAHVDDDITDLLGGDR